MNFRKWYDKYSKDVDLIYNSKSTKDNYKSQIKIFLNHFKKEIEPKSISNDKIKDWIIEANTISTRKQRLCALNSFYKITMNMPSKIQKISYPKNTKKLPIILSKGEIQRMFNNCDNIKHKVILSLLYSTGIRVSELINLKWSNIDRNRMIINIIDGKGKKDRQVPLSEKLIPLLKEYWKNYKPETYILNGQKTLKYNKESVNKVIKNIATKSNIKKRVYSHLLRHTSFTHMVESGTDINLIQKIAGHNNVKTTMIYIQISDTIVKNIKSPMNEIDI